MPTVADTVANVRAAELVESRPRGGGELVDNLDREDMLRQRREHSRLVAGAGAELEDLLTPLELERLAHQRNDVRLRQRLPRSDGDREISIGISGLIFGGEAVPLDATHDVQHTLVANSPSLKLLSDHAPPPLGHDVAVHDPRVAHKNRDLREVAARFSRPTTCKGAIMKLIFLILCVGLFSAAVFGKDLSAIARKERERRQSIQKTNPRKTFTNDDLDVFTARPEPPPSRTQRENRRSSSDERRDLRKEESHWRDEKLRHDRELARVDANIRRLEWRLRERQLKAKAQNRPQDDPAVTLVEESLEGLREQRQRLELEFRDRARKAGAFPGWLR